MVQVPPCDRILPVLDFTFNPSKLTYLCIALLKNCCGSNLLHSTAPLHTPYQERLTTIDHGGSSISTSLRKVSVNMYIAQRHPAGL